MPLGAGLGDLLPVSVQINKAEMLLLDRHNDLIATFEPTFELAEAERLVRLINREVSA